MNLPNEFWANIRFISQEVGYTNRGERSAKIPTIDEIRKAFGKLGLSTDQIFDINNVTTNFGQCIFDYLEYRSSILNNTIRGNLMNKESAELEFNRLKSHLSPRCPLPYNKQKGEKKNFAFFTCIINMIIDDHIGNARCDYDPRSLTTVTQNQLPLRTLSRRVDGAFPSVVDPIAIWEIKEYYYTTTFGSRVADGVYETLLDGMELLELDAATGRKIQHVLFIDDYYTWWDCGRSYLCRIIDMLHMGYVDEVIFGREVFTRLPQLVNEWMQDYQSRQYYQNLLR